MSVIHILPNGEAVPVPVEIVAEGRAAEQSFYDNQVKRLEAEAQPTVAPAAPVSEGSAS